MNNKEILKNQIHANSLFINYLSHNKGVHPDVTSAIDFLRRQNIALQAMIDQLPISEEPRVP